MAEREKLQISKAREEKLEKIGEGRSLGAALARVILKPYTYRAEWDDALKQHFGKPAGSLGSLEAFYDHGVRKAVAEVTSPAYAETVGELLKLRMEGIFSSSISRRSLHADSFYLYTEAVEMELTRLCRFYQYGVTAAEALKRNHDEVQAGLDLLLAGEIRRRNREIVETIRDAIYEDAPEVPVSRTIIRAVIYSADEGLIGDLLKLLLAARLQEGLRQAILENADCGRPEVLARILGFSVEHDLLRYSSAMRAFMTWIGLGYEAVDQKMVRAYAEVALRALTDPEKRREYLGSSNHLELYFALWATGVYRVEDIDLIAAKLLSDPEKHRRIVGWSFIYQLDSVRAATRYAGEHLDEPDEEVRAWVVRCYAVTHSLTSVFYYSRDPEFKIREEANDALPKSREERRRHYYAFRQYYLDLDGKKKEFTGNPFPFSQIRLDGFEVLKRMFSLAGYDMDPELVEDLVALTPEMPADGKTAMLLHFLRPEEPAHRVLIRELLKDRAVSIKDMAVKRLRGTSLGSEDLMALTECLRTRSAELRKNILAVLAGQDRGIREGLIRTMLRDPENNRRMAGLELLLDEEANDPGMKTRFREALAGLEGEALSPEAAVLLRRLTVGQEGYTKENGFGLYDPALTARVREEEPEKAAAADAAPAASQKKGLFGRLFAGKAESKTEPDLLDLKAVRQRVILTDGEVIPLLEGMNEVFERHAKEEFCVENWDGSAETVLFGSCNRLQLMIYPKKNERKVEFRFDQIPHAEEFRTAIEKALGGRHDRIPALLYTTGRVDSDPGWGRKWTDWYLRDIGKASIDMNCHQYGYDKYGQRYWTMVTILEHCSEWLTEEDLPEILRIYRSLVSYADEDRLGREVTEDNGKRAYYGSYGGQVLINCRFLSTWRQIVRGMALSGEGFARWFRLEYRLEGLAGCSVMQGLRIEDFLRAFRDGLIPMDCLYERLLSSPNAKDDVRLLTAGKGNDRKRDIEREYPFVTALTEAAVDRILTIEEKRGELPTEVSGPASAIVRFTGGEHFVRLLTAMGKDGFFRGYSFASDETKKCSLSRLIKASYPAEGDTPERMREWLDAAGLTAERAAEAAMYAPQWARLLEKAIDWPGLTSAVWFYHAHVSEHFSAEKETEVALHSRFTPEEFNDGAFDADWYREAVSVIGEKRFRFLYKAAKYITATGSYHRRSQLFVDAVSGRLDAGELEAEIRDKRSQEKLRAYPLIPAADEEEILHRYLFLEEFRKGSRAFGAQRRESEKKACQAALRNLAVTAGVGDTDRLVWRMEMRSFEQMQELFTPKEVGGVLLSLSLPEEGGKASLVIEKDGRQLKTLPKALAKDPYAAELKEAQKALADQYRRSRRTLEEAMVGRSGFRTEELKALLEHPVIAPLLKALLWIGEGEEAGCCIGFLSLEEGALLLTDEQGAVHAAEGFGTLRIAHPYDLMKAGTWSDWLRLLMEQRIVQPFKQVAREYYPLTDEEREERTLSRRYAGFQVQPKQFFGALKSRGWTADYEEGLQKVVHGQSVIIRLYAAADWFSPADIEPPTLEQVEFFDRRSGETLPLEDLDPILFSETMRDLDMAVSVAYAGGVDPEASHSTVEMRRAILEEFLALLKVTNVEFLTRHARVTGEYGTYTVHLGSGIVHMEGRGMIPILAVPSQTRGRVFLPFADDDPKTAEIVSKVLLLAKDKSIKDPAILERIR